MTQATKIILIYDRECPACEYYCRLVRIGRDLGQLSLLDARIPSPEMDEITAVGWDIDQGMVLKIDNQLYYGADAIHALALISSRSGLLNRINFWLFKSRYLAGIFYPLLRSMRNLLLKVLRKTKINNLGISNNDHF